MKAYYILIIFYFLSACLGRNQSQQIPFETTLNNNLDINNIISDFVEENISSNGKKFEYMIEIRSCKLYDTLILNLRTSAYIFEKSIPVYFTNYENVPILFYSGLEPFILFEKAHIKRFENFLEKNSRHLYKSDIKEDEILDLPPTHSPIVWELKYFNNNLISKERVYE